MALKNCMTRRSTLIAVGIGAVVAFAFSIASMADTHWVDWKVSVPHKDVTFERHFGLWQECRIQPELSINDCKSDFLFVTGSLKAARAFVVLGFLASLPAVVAAFYGAFKRNAEHPWPKIAFFALAIHTFCVFCALIAFGSYVNKDWQHHLTAQGVPSEWAKKWKYNGGWGTLLFNFFLNFFLAGWIMLGFGRAGAVGTGALPEGTTSFSDAAMGGGYQVEP